MKTLVLIMSALTFGVLGCSNPYERDNPTDPIFVYKVTFNASDATGGTPPAALSGSWGDVVTLPDGGDLAKTGYVFDGWTDPADSKNYPIGSTYTITGNAAINVMWRPLITITFNGNGATSGSTWQPITVASDSLVQIPYVASWGGFEKTGYAFDGWYANISGTGNGYEEGSSYSFSSDITLYAKWLPAYTVTLDGNGATVYGKPTTSWNIAVGYSRVLPSPSSLFSLDTKSGHVLGGWNTNSSGTGTNYKCGSSYTPTGDVTLYANWISCNSETQFCDMRDEQAYRITTIGEQIWFAENLNYNATGSKCGDYDYKVADNNTAYCDKYGRLYNWATAMSLASSCNSNSCSNQIKSPHQGICPSGWHIPSSEDLGKLYRYVDGTDGTFAGYDSPTAGKHLKSVSGWTPYEGIENLDTYGFSALPGGYSTSNGYFTSFNFSGEWWTASEYYSSRPDYARYMGMRPNDEYAIWYGDPKSYFLSIRCLKD